jgi:DNA-binding CsgD family transcriptional regulator
VLLINTWRPKAFIQGKKSLKRRFLLPHLLPLVSAVVFSALGLLFLEITGAPAGNEGRELKRELFHFSKDATRQFGGVSARAVTLSRELSKNITQTLAGLGLTFDDLSGRPDLYDIIEEIIDGEVHGLLAALDTAGYNGVFLVLDTQANPTLPNVRDSKAGVYIRNAKPAVPGMETPRLCLRGMPELIVKNGLDAWDRWDREFNTADRLFYHEPLKKYQANPALPLSLLYFWTAQSAIPGLDERALLCSVPIIGENGQVMGVCGFEISAGDFERAYTPNPDQYPRIISLLAPLDSDGLHLERSLTAGNYAPQPVTAAIRHYRSGLTLYQGDGLSLAGVQEEPALYPANSPFAGSPFALVVAVPCEDLDRAFVGGSIRVILIVFTLLAASLALAVIMTLRVSRRYVKLLIESLKQGPAEKTDMPEIGELASLIDTIMVDKIHKALDQRQEAAQKAAQEGPEKEGVFEDFLKRRKTLTPVEREIFDYYADGLSRKEIMEKRRMSNGTFNSHSAHIFAKLGVRSKEEIALYMDLIRRSGIGI